MAEIYKGLAYDLAGIKRTVCIKKILPHIAASPEFIDMLVDEAKIAVKLSQGNIAQVYDLGKAGDDYFIVMEFVEGQSLSKIFKKAVRTGPRIPVPVACSIISEMASGLDYMHRKSDETGQSLHIVHRDISPQNIVVSYSGTVKIIDFGIAKAAVKIGQTESGILKGKFAYMSPEQARGDPLDHRSDIFSLGVIFHELLTGRRLFKGADNKETLKNVRRAKVEPPSLLAPDVPKELDAIVLKALDKNRRHRYAFTSDLQGELLRFLHTFYPDFKLGDAAEYLQQLFADELALKRKMPLAELQTPHLILEKTKEGTEEENTKGAGGIDWREFMLEAEWPEEKEEKKEVESSEEEAGEEEVSEPTRRKWFENVWQARINWLLGLCLLGLVGGISYWLGHREIPQPQPSSTQPVEEPPPPAAATAVVASTPPGAKIYLNDQETPFTTPATIPDLPLNQEQTLGLYLKNYQYYKVPLLLQAGESKHFHVALVLDFATLAISSKPSGAEVWINGQLAGITPLTQEQLRPGKILLLEIKQEGFLPVTREFQVEPGKAHRLQVLLERLPNLPQEPKNDSIP